MQVQLGKLTRLDRTENNFGSWLVSMYPNGEH